jgi:hypothetical protein
MKKLDVLRLNEVFNRFGDMKYGVKFSYFLAKNRIAIKPEVEALDEARKPDQEFLDFELERVKLAQEYSDKDSSGKPMIQNGAFVIVEKLDTFDKQMEKLKKKFKSAIEQREAQMKEFDKLLKDEYTMTNPFKISFAELPQSIEPSIVEVLITSDLIKDE